MGDDIKSFNFFMSEGLGGEESQGSSKGEWGQGLGGNVHETCFVHLTPSCRSSPKIKTTFRHIRAMEAAKEEVVQWLSAAYLEQGCIWGTGTKPSAQPLLHAAKVQAVPIGLCLWDCSRLSLFPSRQVYGEL